MSSPHVAGTFCPRLSAFAPRKHALSRSERRHRPRRSGLTLVEILISTAVTLIMIFAIVEIFERVGSAVAQGRASIEMSGQIRGAAHRLREDLRAVTVPMRPWSRSSSSLGYFEIFEGTERDTTNLLIDSRFGDRDDVIAFTARSVDEPFVGRLNGNAIESQVAEIIWWVTPDASGNSLSLHRRVLLVRPDLGTVVPNGAINTAALQIFYNDNDVSIRLNGAGGLVANTLADLTKRENRFAHFLNGFPFMLDVNSGNPNCLVSLVQTGLHQGDDIILSHIQAFDVRVFDPLAQIRSDGNRALVPSDPGWAAGGPLVPPATGAFVDLNYLGGAGSVFSGPAQPQSGLFGLAPASVYDTWSFHYEHDGIDQDGNGIVDQGTNGVDDNGQNGPDDILERETSPPYPVPLRGIQIKIRIDDPDSRQVREATVVNEFIPE